MSALGKELRQLHDGLPKTAKKSHARDSSIPDSRHTTLLGDKSYKSSGAKPKQLKKTTSFLGYDEPSFVENLNELTSRKQRVSKCLLDKTKSSDQGPSKNGLPKSNKPNTKSSAGRSGVTYKVGEAGMFLNALVNDKVVKLLVDSGATLSILSPDVLNSVGFGNSQLVRLSKPIVTANDSPLKTDSLLTINMQLGNDNFAQAYAVAEIEVDGILGLSFLKDHHCFMDMDSLSLKVGGKRHALHMEARSEEDYKGPVFKCAMRTFQCLVCDFCNNKEANLKRHKKRCHPGLAKEEDVKLGSKENKCEEMREQREDDWLAQDPGDLIGEISDEDSDKEDDEDTTSDKEAGSQEKEVDESLLEGRMFRKPTTPLLPIISKQKSSDVHLSPAQPKTLRKEDQSVQTSLSV
uniref:Peptidase A2 domain-containing protein n=1 Tax=Magallana gigas TaxID=29159 RepID=A0A8W8HNW3_MAGGI